MFVIDYVFLSIGFLLLFFSFLVFVFSNRFFAYLKDCDLHFITLAFGIAFILAPFLSNLFFNRCDVCQQLVSSDYCTHCGSFVASDFVCSCGEYLSDGYDFCPSCGIELEFSSD